MRSRDALELSSAPYLNREPKLDASVDCHRCARRQKQPELVLADGSAQYGYRPIEFLLFGVPVDDSQLG